MLENAALVVAVRVLNHLLGEEDWARARLRRFAGQRARVELGAGSAIALPLFIGEDGLFAVDQAAASGATPDVTITLAADAPLKTLTAATSLLAGATISGSAELAENLGFVFRNLRWDAEDDLSYFVGDIAARRLVAGGKRFALWQKQQLANLAANVAEYLTEERPTIVGARGFSAFRSEVAELADEVAKLEARFARLSSSAKG